MKRIVQQIHSDERGAIGVLLLLTVFVLVVLVSMIWNSGEYSAQRIRTQTAADVAAYDTTLYISRGNNLITGSNMAIVRADSAICIAIASAIAEGKVEDNLDERWWLAFVDAEEWGEEQARVIEMFFTKTLPALLAAGRVTQQAELFHEFQRQLVAELPEAIERHRSELVWKYGCYIRLGQVQGDAPSQQPASGQQRIRLPLRESSYPHPQIWFPLKRRMQIDKQGLDLDFALLWMGSGYQEWDEAMTPALSLYMALPVPGKQHYYLPTASLGVFEVPLSSGFPPRIPEDSRQRDFSVVSVASTSAFRPPHLLLQKYFARAFPMSAYAEAETFNGMEANWAVLLKYAGYEPWRLWSKPGWNWQSRLSRSDALPLILPQDDQLRRALNLPQNFLDDPNDLRAINLH